MARSCSPNAAAATPPGGWHAPSGKVDTGESILDAVIREGVEEVGILVEPTDLRCVHTMHVHHPHEEPRIGWCFEATRWTGEPVNQEPPTTHYRLVLAKRRVK